jgi:hypothetical protein
MNTPDNTKATMSREVFCKRVGISLVTEWRMRQAGKLSHYQIGDKILYGEHHVQEFLQQHEHRARVAAGK